MKKASKEVRTLTEAERKRLEKFKNTRGRKHPAEIPARLARTSLARTSAFAPATTHLDTDSKFERLYVVPGHSVIKVSGRELDTQHRDTIYAVFRLVHSVVETRREGESSALPWSKIYETRTTWRDLLLAMKRSAHPVPIQTRSDDVDGRPPASESNRRSADSHHPASSDPTESVHLS